MNLVPKNLYFDGIFDDFFPETSCNKMKCDILDEDGNYKILLEVPGYAKDDIKIETNNGYVTVTAEKSNETEEENKNYIRKERTYGKISRQFYIGEFKDVIANYKDGVLCLTIPKQEEKTEKKQIEID